jgi:AraC-like DNA-binding protein
MSITQIAAKLCFSSSQHFATNFLKHFSMTPKEYRTAFKEVQAKQPLSSAAEVSAHIDTFFCGSTGSLIQKGQ